MPPRALAAPLHRHSREDEYSFVLEGRVGALLGDEVVYGGPGDLIFKPRGRWHVLERRGRCGAPARDHLPAGFERYFEEVIELVRGGPPPPGALADVAARFGLEVDLASIPQLAERFRLRLPAAAP